MLFNVHSSSCFFPTLSAMHGSQYHYTTKSINCARLKTEIIFSPAILHNIHRVTETLSIRLSSMEKALRYPGRSPLYFCQLAKLQNLFYRYNNNFTNKEQLLSFISHISTDLKFSISRKADNNHIVGKSIYN